MPRSSHSKFRPCEVGKTMTRAPPCPKSKRSMSRPRVGLYHRWCSRCITVGNSTCRASLPSGSRGQELGEQPLLSRLVGNFLGVPLDGDEVVTVLAFDAFD